MPTVVTKTIGSAGGRDYSTLATWMAACPADLVTADQVYRGEVYNDSEFVITAALSIGSGVTTDGTRYIELTAAAGQSFVDHPDVRQNPLCIDPSKGVTVTCNTGYTSVFVVTARYTRISRFQVRHPYTGGGANYCIATASGTPSACRYSNLLIVSNSAGLGVDLGEADTLENSVVVMTRSNGVQGAARMYHHGTFLNCLFAMPSDVATKQPNALWNSYWGSVGTPVTIKNCVAVGFTGVINNPVSFTATNCYTDVASPPTGFTTVAYDTGSGTGFFSTIGAAPDFRLRRTSALIGAGTNSGAPTTDITGLARPQGTNVDVGPWEVFIDPGPKYRPFGDIGQPQWASPSGWKRWEALDEAAASDSDYVFANVGSAPYVAEIGPLAAGTYTTRVRASVASGTGTLTIRLLDASLAVLATSSPQTVTTTPTTFEPALTFASGTAYYISAEITA